MEFAMAIRIAGDHVARTRAKTKVRRHDPLKVTAYTAVAVTLVFSAWLNGEANVHYAGEGHFVSAWAMGLSVPALVFLMGRITQLSRERRSFRVSNAAGAVGIVLLFLSVH